MSTLYSKIQGQYVPTFMYMILNLDFEKMSYLEVLHSEVFHHEFIHYLQDLSTTHGMMNSISNISILQSLALTAKESTPSISLPISERQGTSDYNNTIMKIINGDSFEVLSPMRVKPRIDDVSKNGIDCVLLEYYNIENKAHEKYRFGALAIRETMAHFAESRLHKSKTVADFPYLTGYYVAKEFYETVAEDDMSLLAVCDASLMSCNPGVAFVETLIDMKLTNYSPICYKQTYDYAEQFIMQNVNLSSLQLYAINVASSLESFCKYFGHGHLYDREFEFICNSIRRAYRNKMRNPYYILDLVSTPLSHFGIDSLILKTRLPIIYDVNDQGYIDDRYHVSEETDYSIFRTMYELNLFFLHTGKTGSPVEYGCELYYCCLLSPHKSIVNQRCLSEPWEMAEEKYLCPFAKLWHRWGLTGKKLMYSSI